MYVDYMMIPYTVLYTEVEHVCSLVFKGVLEPIPLVH